MALAVVAGVCLGRVLARYSNEAALKGIWVAAASLISLKLFLGRQDCQLGDAIPHLLERRARGRSLQCSAGILGRRFRKPSPIVSGAGQVTVSTAPLLPVASCSSGRGPGSGCARRSGRPDLEAMRGNRRTVGTGSPMWPMLAAMSKLRALWSGDLPLGEAFWTYAVWIGITVNLLTSLAFLALVAWDRPFAALFVGYALSVPYNVVAVVGVWRSAARYQGERIHADLARIVSLVGMALLSVT